MPDTADALKAAYRQLILRAPLPVTREVDAPDKRALDALVFDVLGLSGDERSEVIAAIVSKTTERLQKARSVEGPLRGDVQSISDDDLLEYGLADTLAEVGLRRFPADFPIGMVQEVSLPHGRSADSPPRVEAMMAEGLLVWPDGSHVEFEHIEAAQLVGLLLSLGWSGPVRVPRERVDAEALFAALDAYVSSCATHFHQTVGDIAQSEAQVKRVVQLLRLKLGGAMFNGSGEPFGNG